jgi:hypothetical protein
MQFFLTPEEAQATAGAVANHLAGLGFRVSIEKAVSDDAPYRTTLYAEARGLTILVEAQGVPTYHPGLWELPPWLLTQRPYSELYIATGENQMVSGVLLKKLKQAGMGLIFVTLDGNVDYHLKPRNPALIVNPDPTLNLGRCSKEVRAIVTAFNSVDRKAALRNMCDLVELETQTLAKRASDRGWLIKTAAEVDQLDWANQINLLAASGAYKPGKTPLIGAKLKDDLVSFKGARNLLDHPAATKRDAIARERQFAERMMMGPRLVADLLALQRRAR